MKKGANLFLRINFILLIFFTGCKGYWETKLVTKENCEVKFPEPPCPEPIIIDDSFTIDSLVEVIGSKNETITLLESLTDSLSVVYEDSLLKISMSLDSSKKRVITRTEYKDRYIPINTANVNKFLLQINKEKVRGDSLYKEVYFWKTKAANCLTKNENNNTIFGLKTWQFYILCFLLGFVSSLIFKFIKK